jgi:hypothetical protein
MAIKSIRGVNNVFKNGLFSSALPVTIPGDHHIHTGGRIMYRIQFCYKCIVICAFLFCAVATAQEKVEFKPLVTEVRAPMAVGPNGEVYISFNNRTDVIKYSSSGALIGSMEFEIGTPSAIAVGKDGSVYIALAEAKRILHYAQDGELIGGWDIEAGHPLALSIGPGGEVVASITSVLKTLDAKSIFRGLRVFVFSPDGQILKSFALD